MGKLKCGSFAIECTPRAVEPMPNTLINIQVRITNNGTEHIPGSSWRVYLSLEPSDGVGMAYHYDYDPNLQPITPGTWVHAQLMGVLIDNAMAGKTYDVVIIVYNADKTEEYGRGRCDELLKVAGEPPQYGASLTNLRAEPTEYSRGDPINIKYNIANTGTVRTTYNTYVEVSSEGHSYDFGPFLDTVDPGGNVSAGNLIELPPEAPVGIYDIGASVQYPVGTELDSAILTDAFNVRQLFIYGYVTDAMFGQPIYAAVSCDETGQSTLTDENGFYNLDPLASENLSIRASAILGGYIDQTKIVYYDSINPVQLDFQMNITGGEWYVIDDFESYADGQQDPGNWVSVLAQGDAVHEADTEYAGEGNVSIKVGTNTKQAQVMEQLQLQNDKQPRNIRFSWRQSVFYTSGMNGNCNIGFKDSSGNISMFWNSQATLGLNYYASNTDTGVNKVDSTWIMVEFKNIDWISKTYDVWVNGEQKVTNVGFSNTSAIGVKEIEIYVYTADSFNRMVWIDGIYFRDGTESLYAAVLTIGLTDPPNIEYSPGDSALVKFNIQNSGNMMTNYFSYITIKNGAYERLYGPFRDEINPDENAWLNKVISLPSDAPEGSYEIIVSIQFPDGTILAEDSWVDYFTIIGDRPQLSVSPTDLNMSGQIYRSFTISNIGTGILSWSLSFGGSYFSVSNNSGSLSAGESETIQIQKLVGEDVTFNVSISIVGNGQMASVRIHQTGVGWYEVANGVVRSGAPVLGTVAVHSDNRIWIDIPFTRDHYNHTPGASNFRVQYVDTIGDVIVQEFGPTVGDVISFNVLGDSLWTVDEYR